MCGILGILKLNSSDRVQELRLEKMSAALTHRGPDDDGVISTGQVGLGHRRLSIIDHAGGHQPMPNSDRSVWLTYNGEIYNFKELRAELESRGHRFRSRSDTEVVLLAYEEFGEECVQRLRGMFSFAIWDSNKRKLFMARDRLGIKPLYYAIAGNELVFASEMKAILAADSFKPEFNEEILPEFLATRFISGTETFFKKIRKLRPGCTLSWSQETGFKGRRYWSPPQEIDDSGETLSQRAKKVRTRLEETVASHMVSDVPVGLFLSGGLDSTGLAALAARQANGPVQTFSVGYNENKFSELSYAKLVAESLGNKVVHKEVKVTPSQFFQTLPKMVWHEDEPIAFPSSISLYFVSDLARRNGVKVVLSGEGADELFLGYNRYRVTAWNEKLGKLYWSTVPRSIRNGIRNGIDVLPGALKRYASRSFLNLSPDARQLFFENFATFPSKLQQVLLRDPDLLLMRDQFSVEMRCFNEKHAGTFEKMANADLQTYLVELLMKQDQMSMAASIESRVPFLDHKFVEHALSIPGKYKVRGWQTKAVLREALRDVIPRAIIKRPKMGFPTPVGQWLRGAFKPLINEFVLSERAMARSLFNPVAMQNLVDEHVEGYRDHGERLWLLVNLEIWQRIFLEGEEPESMIEIGERAGKNQYTYSDTRLTPSVASQAGIQ